MDKNNPLLPFAFTTSSFSDNHLDTTPRDREIRDENASSQYHTRTPQMKKKRPILNFIPSMKRKMGGSFNEKCDIKRRDMEASETGEEALDEEVTIVDVEGDDDDFGGYAKKRQVFKLEERGQTRGETNTIPDEMDNFDLNRDGDTDYEREILDNKLPPSSPLEPLLTSEFDFSTTTNFVPESPVHEESHDIQLPSEIDINYYKPTVNFLTSQSYSPKKSVLTHFSSDADFGIDKFNRFKHPSITNPSSEHGYEVHKPNSYNAARDIILQSFEEIKTKIDLENMELHEIPDEIKDMNNLVIFNSNEPISYQLYLTGNKLRHLNPSLFKFTKLNVLSLRQNKLESIPPLIGKLKNLTDFSLASNRLQYLPYQILELTQLQTFRAGPNPYMKVSDDAIAVSTSSINPTRRQKFISPIRYLNIQSSGHISHEMARGSSQGLPDVGLSYEMARGLSYRSIDSQVSSHGTHLSQSQSMTYSHSLSPSIPSLKSKCLNKIAQYDISYQETKSWKKFTPKIYHGLIIEAITKGRYKDTCSECPTIVVEPFSEVIEWWDILQNKNVPIRRQFCCGGCTRKYQSRLSIETDES